MLPEYTDESEDSGNENQGKGCLRDGAGRKRFDITFGATFVIFFMPGWEGGKEEKTEEGEDDGNDSVNQRKYVLHLYCHFPWGTRILT